MEKNNKLAILGAVSGALTAYQIFKIVQDLKYLKKLEKMHSALWDIQIQQDFDESFTTIVEHYDD